MGTGYYQIVNLQFPLFIVFVFYKIMKPVIPNWYFMGSPPGYLSTSTEKKIVCIKSEHVVVMVGLPGRSKTSTANKLVRYLKWIGIKSKVFSVESSQLESKDPYVNCQKKRELSAQCTTKSLEEISLWLHAEGEVAHGESEMNVQGRIGGNSNLSERGLCYARKLAQYMKEENVAPGWRVWTSWMKRCIQTAAHIELPQERWKALNEINAGIFEGLTYQEIKEKYPDEHKARCMDKFNYRYPNGENYKDVISRLEPVVMEMERQGKVLVITHQSIIRCLLGFFLETPTDTMPHMKVLLHTVYKLSIFASGVAVEEINLPVDAVTNECKSTPRVSGPNVSKFNEALVPGRNIAAALTNKEDYSCEFASPKYFALCSIGGIVSCGTTHTMVVPLDLVKCRMQVDPAKYSTLVNGIKMTIKEEGLFGLTKGWGPTFIGYSIQGFGKFGFYEVFKVLYSRILGEERSYLWRTSLYLAASATAEFIADIGLCPFEAMKVRIQTQPGFSNTMREAFPKILQSEGWNGFYKGLVPLWLRQIPYTMMKFACFERTVEFLYLHFVPKPRSECTKGEQLIVTFSAGYIAGVFCAIVSHPADTVVSKLNQRAGSKPMDIMKELGFFGIWKGLGTRIIMIGTLTAAQWFIYDGVKVMFRLPRPPPPEMPESLKRKMASK